MLSKLGGEARVESEARYYRRIGCSQRALVLALLSGAVVTHALIGELRSENNLLQLAARAVMLPGLIPLQPRLHQVHARE